MSEEQLPEGEVEGGAEPVDQEATNPVEGEDAFDGQEGKLPNRLNVIIIILIRNQR
jgi:hypothetical protein